MSEQDGHGENSRQRQEHESCAWFLPEDEGHKERERGVARKKETRLEIEIHINAVKNPVPRIDGVRMNADVRERDEESPDCESERKSLESEDDVTRFRKY